MSVRATTAVWFESEAKGAAKLVLLAIADCANDEGIAWPSMATVARKCGLTSERGVREHVKRLEESGELEVIERPGRSSVYRIRVGDFKNSVRASGPRQDPAPRQKSTPRQDGAPDPGRGVPDTPAGECRTPRQDSGDDPKGTIKETKEGTAPAPAFPIGEGQASGGLGELRERLAIVFPHAPGMLTSREETLLLGAQAALAAVGLDVWEILRIWFVETDEVIRDGKLWPRSRAEFLEHAGEAIEKACKWWKQRGRRWWEHRQRTRGVPVAEDDPGDVIEDRGEALKFFREA